MLQKFRENKERIARNLVLISILLLVGFAIPEYTLRPEVWASYIWVPFVSAAIMFLAVVIEIERRWKN